MTKNRIRALYAALFVLLCVPLTVFAIRAGAGPSQHGGGYYHTLVDRVDISVDSTAFTLKKSVSGAESFTVPFTLTLQKCEADFYATLDDLEIADLDLSQAEFLCATPGMETVRPAGLALPVQNGESVPLTFNVTLTANFANKGDYTATLKIAYTAGLTKETADSKLTEIPLTFNVE